MGASPAGQGSGACSVLIAGDWAPIRAFASLLDADPTAAYGDLLSLLRAATLRVVNCECALAEGGQPVWKSGSVFKGSPRHARVLREAGFEVACLANNHVLDYGEDGLAQSLRSLGEAGVRTLGAGLSEEQAWSPLRLQAGDTALSLVNFCEGEDLGAARGGPGVAGWDVPRAAELVGALKARGDCVIVVAHAGLEYVPFPPPYLQRACRALIDAGADCVAAHHAHVPQGIEMHRGRPIAYSLGNFLFYQPTDLHWRKVGFLLELRLAGGALQGFAAHPYRISEGGLRRLVGPEQEGFRQALRRISTPLEGADGCRRAWEACLSHYGAEGLRQELAGIAAALGDEPLKGAAMLRNRLTTPQHVELWRDLLAHLLEGGGRQAGEPAVGRAAELGAVVREWFERRVQPEGAAPARPRSGSP